MPMFSKGIVLTQHKEPAFSAPLLDFTNSGKSYVDAPYQIEDIPALSGSAIIDIANQASIVDEQDGKKLWKKMQAAAQKTDGCLLIDAIDDEPYVSSRIAPMLQFREELLSGIELCLKATGFETAHILVYHHITDVEISFPKRIGAYHITRIKGGYPAILSNRMQKEFGQKNHLIVGVGALIRLHQAIYRKEIQNSTFVTVAGSAIASPMNLEVSVGTPITMVLERCGLKSNPKRVVVGGPMTGVAILDTDNTLVTPTTAAVLAFVEDSVSQRTACVNCGRCETVCPMGLDPSAIYRCVASKHNSLLENHDPTLCIDCGCCSYVCPSKLDLSTTVQMAKNYVLENPQLPSNRISSWSIVKMEAARFGTFSKNTYQKISTYLSTHLEQQKELQAEKNAKREKERAEKKEQEEKLRQELAKQKAIAETELEEKNKQVEQVETPSNKRSSTSANQSTVEKNEKDSSIAKNQGEKPDLKNTVKTPSDFLDDVPEESEDIIVIGKPSSQKRKKGNTLSISVNSESSPDLSPTDLDMKSTPHQSDTTSTKSPEQKENSTSRTNSSNNRKTTKPSTKKKTAVKAEDTTKVNASRLSTIVESELSALESPLEEDEIVIGVSSRSKQKPHSTLETVNVVSKSQKSSPQKSNSDTPMTSKDSNSSSENKEDKHEIH